MTTYEALIKTAEHIEAYPHLYDFEDATMPSELHPKACILGRLGQILGISVFNADLIAPRVFGMDSGIFFRHVIWHMEGFQDNLHLAQLVVPALRRFAERYRNQVMPPEIRAIFNPQPEKESTHAVV